MPQNPIVTRDVDTENDGKGHTPALNQPLAVRDTTAKALLAHGRDDI